MKKVVRLTESDLHRVVKESVNKILKEFIGGSSPNGYGFNKGHTERTGNQGGSFGSSPLDDMHDEKYLEANRKAKLRDDEIKRKRGW